MAQPWATLQYAVDNCPAGDTIIIEPGTYVGCRIESSATAVAPKTLMSETPWGAVINAKEPTRAKHGSYLEVEKFGDTVQYWVIDGVEVMRQRLIHLRHRRPRVRATSPAGTATSTTP